MPATQLSPSIRRRLSDDARQLLRYALCEADGDCDGSSLDKRGDDTRNCNIGHLPLTERLQNFRAQLRLELLVPREAGGEATSGVSLRVTVSRASYVLRYQVATLGAEVSVLNRAGVMTSWITLANGHHVQLGVFLAPSAYTSHHQRDLEIEATETCKPQILALLGVLDSLDLLDMFHASMEAVEVPSGIYQGAKRIYHASSGKNTYVFTFDDRTGCPLAITQAPVGSLDASSSSSSGALQLAIEDYVRHDDSCIDAPLGIQSDVDLVLDAAISCFYQWTLAGRQQLEQIFALLDKDGDGSVSGQDLTDQLLDAGHSPERAQSIAMEMTRLLCDSTDPSEEVTFCRLAGFWVVMLADDLRVSDPRNERRVLPALEQLFLGPA